MENEDYICIFDYGSVPDVKLTRKNLGFEGSDEEISLQVLAWQKEQNGSKFLPLPFRKIVSICAVITNRFGKFIKVNEIEGENEEEMLRNFFAFIDKSEPKLVSFNGKNYDCPLFVLGVLEYNIRTSACLDMQDKWSNYKTRFSELKRCDLLESLGGRLRFDSVCAMAELPGKYDVSGTEVMDLYYRDQVEKIHEYCESDVLSTHMLFLEYELVKGNLAEEDYGFYLNLMAEYLKEKKASHPYAPYLIKAYKEEFPELSIQRIIMKCY